MLLRRVNLGSDRELFGHLGRPDPPASGRCGWRDVVSDVSGLV